MNNFDGIKRVSVRRTRLQLPLEDHEFHDLAYFTSKGLAAK